MDFIFATYNEGKLKEARAIFTKSKISALPEIGFNKTIVEDGESFADNAIIKARAVRDWLASQGRVTCPVFSDDSGLEIDALGKLPGVNTKQYLGEDVPYEIRCRKIVEQMKNVPENKRTARFVCVIACIWPDSNLQTAEGIVEGPIAP